MPLLSEYAITPDVLFSSFYSSTELKDALISQVANSIMASGIVRDLRGGEWSLFLNHPECFLNPRSKEFIKMLKKERRLQPFPSALPEEPITGADWCKEALASHLQSCLSGIITTKSVAEQFKSKKHIVSSVNDLGNSTAEWWNPLKGTETVKRDIDSYLWHLNSILLYANSLIFVDPHLDPTRPSYSNFKKIVETIAKRERIPSEIHIHRQGDKKQNKDNQWITIDEWRNRFSEAFAPIISGTRIKIKIFIWKKLHDRFLLSDLMGICLLNGFDEHNPKLPTEDTFWSRLERKQLDEGYGMYFRPKQINLVPGNQPILIS